MSERLCNFRYKSRGFEILRDLTVSVLSDTETGPWLVYATCVVIGPVTHSDFECCRGPNCNVIEKHYFGPSHAVREGNVCWNGQFEMAQFTSTTSRFLPVVWTNCWFGLQAQIQFTLTATTLRPKQNGHPFANDSFKFMLVNENCCILIQTSLEFLPKGAINNKPTLFQIMARHLRGIKSLFELMMARVSLQYICITRSRWVHTSRPEGAYIFGKLNIISNVISCVHLAMGHNLNQYALMINSLL